MGGCHRIQPTIRRFLAHLPCGQAGKFYESHGLRLMSWAEGLSRLDADSVRSASNRHSAQASQIRSSKSLSVQPNTAISLQTGQKSAYSESRGLTAMAADPATDSCRSSRKRSRRNRLWPLRSDKVLDSCFPGTSWANQPEDLGNPPFLSQLP